MQLHQPTFLKGLADHEGRLLVVSFAPLERLRRWIPHFERNFLQPAYREARQGVADPFARTEFVADPALTAYHAYGLGRNSTLKVYGPSIMWQYTRWALQGKPVKKPAEDPLQRGGNFVVGRDGRLTLSHTGRDQSERPSPSEILRCL